LNLPLDKTLQQSSFAGTLTPEQIVYARKDAEVLIPLMMSLGRSIDREGLTRACEVEMQALPAFVWLSQSGVPFDRPAWKALADQAATESASLVQHLDHDAPKRPGEFFSSWNWGSPVQVKEVLALLGWDIDTSCDAQLALINHPFAELIRRHRSASKRLTTYGHDWLDHVASDGRVYPNWRQLGAASGRTSCQTPNMQQIPRGTDYRKCVRAGEGKTLIKADYATLQMRIAAKFSRDPALVKIFQEGADPHTETAKSTLGKSTITKEDRQIAKSQNFGLLFAMSAKGLQIYAKTTYGVDFTEQEAEKHRATFFKTYPGLARWHAETKRLHCRETRGTTGRRRKLPVNASDTWRLNSPVQADEADGLKSALGLLWQRRADCPSAYPVLAIHDEIVIEVVESEAEQAKAWLEAAMMDGMAPLLDPVPCLVESTVKKTWGG
jgi:DNA polymerase-1